MTAAYEERIKVRTLAQEVQYVNEESVTLAFVDQGYTGQAAWQEGMQLHGITRKEAKISRCFASAPLGYRAELWLGQALSPIGMGLCAMTANPGRAALCRVHHPHATQCH